jgi:hypothetical protein
LHGRYTPEPACDVGPGARPVWGAASACHGVSNDGALLLRRES